MSTRPATLSILFADICDSTRLYETLGDTQALACVGIALERLGGAASGAGGRVLKTMGDAVMCAFPEAAAAAAAAMQMQSVTSDGAAIEGRRMSVRIGFHHGPVIEDRGDVFGDGVNVAARLVGLAKSGQILTTRETQAAFTANFTAQTRELDTVPVKGRQQPVAVCELLWRHSDDETMCIRGAGTAVSATPVRPRLILGGRELALKPDQGPISLGRDAACDVVLIDRMASREHARIEWRGDGCVLTDMSSNGTYLVFAGQAEIRLRRQQVLLHGQGSIGFGHSCQGATSDTVAFELR